MPHSDTEDELAEQPAIALFGVLGIFRTGNQCSFLFEPLKAAK
jgi:hypothetical protein